VDLIEMQPAATALAPVYASERATVYCGDALDVLPILSKGSVDLLVTDPPYGVAYRSNYGGNFAAIAGDDDAAWVPEAIALAGVALRDKRHAYVFGPQVLAAPFRVATELIWDKGALSMGDLALPWATQHEPITFAVKVQSSEKGRGNLPARLRAGSILRYPRPPASRHPTEKPVALLAELIESSSRQGDLVLDPCAGIGSTGVAAILRGRRTILVEIDADYARAAADRVRAAELLADQMGQL
jgi:DNA modification methylase